MKKWKIVKVCKHPNLSYILFDKYEIFFWKEMVFYFRKA